MDTISELESQLSEQSIAVGFAELRYRLSQAMHKHCKEARIHLSGDELEEAREKYHQAMQVENASKASLDQARIKLASIQLDLVKLHMQSPDTTLNVIDELS